MGSNQALAAGQGDMAGIKAMLSRSRLMDTLINLKGNARACIYTEPMWGIPFNLYIPLMAKYMEALGLNALQIGIVATVNLLSQMVSSLFSGIITDKFGRRWTTAIVDLFCWSIPLLIWMNAQGFAWFVVAALLNGTWRVVENSWGLLMVEDAPDKLLVSIYSLSSIAGLLAGFAAPLTSLLVGRFSLVSTMRGLFFFAFLCITAKIVVLQLMTKETALGSRRMAELKGKSIRHAMHGSFGVVGNMFKNRPLMLVLCIMSCVMVIRSAMENFWPLLLTGRLGIREETLPLLAGLRSMGMLACFFLLAPRLNPRHYFRPMSLALLIIASLQFLFFILPPGAGWAVFPGVLAEALALSLLIPLFSSLQMLLLDRAERARMFGFSLAFCLLLTSPFGTINGLLSRAHLALPMLLSACLALLALFLLGKLRRVLEEKHLGMEA
jgi:MFS family permease